VASIRSLPTLARRGVRALPAAVSLLVLIGCSNAPATVTLSRSERLEVQNRALSLLLRAAESELDDVSCNSIEALVRVAPRDGLPIFRKATRSASPLVRYAGFAALGELRDRDSLKLMTAGAGDAHRHVRLAAAFAACRCGKDGYTRVLVRTLTDAPEESLRADAAGLIGRLHEPRAVKWLRAALNQPANKKSRRVTLAIHGALAMLGEEDAVQQIIYYSQGDVEARTDALLILAELGNPQAREALRYRLLGTSEEYDEARLIAARGLGKLGYRDGYDLAIKNLTYTDPNRSPTADNPDRTYPVRSMAVHALAEIGDPRALEPLREMAATSQDRRLQVAACYAICRILSR
jgi:HEAT repeat protein